MTLTIERLLTRFDIGLRDGNGGPDLADLLRALEMAEHLIGRAVDESHPAIDDVTLERVTIRPRLPDGREISGLRIGCEEDGLTFTITLLPGVAL